MDNFIVFTIILVLLSNILSPVRLCLYLRYIVPVSLVLKTTTTSSRVVSLNMSNLEGDFRGPKDPDIVLLSMSRSF